MAKMNDQIRLHWLESDADIGLWWLRARPNKNKNQFVKEHRAELDRQIEIAIANAATREAQIEAHRELMGELTKVTCPFCGSCKEVSDQMVESMRKELLESGKFGTEPQKWEKTAILLEYRELG